MTGQSAITPYTFTLIQPPCRSEKPKKKEPELIILNILEAKVQSLHKFNRRSFWTLA